MAAAADGGGGVRGLPFGASTATAGGVASWEKQLSMSLVATDCLLLLPQRPIFLQYQQKKKTEKMREKIRRIFFFFFTSEEDEQDQAISKRKKKKKEKFEGIRIFYIAKGRIS